MNLYAEQAIELHKERVREIERYIFVEHANASLKSGPGPLDRGLALLGRWMIGAGRRLQARQCIGADTGTAYYLPLSR